jgi:hypothetical protein
LNRTKGGKALLPVGGFRVLAAVSLARAGGFAFQLPGQYSGSNPGILKKLFGRLNVFK